MARGKTNAGGGGISLKKANITKVDSGSFTLAENTSPATKQIAHNLGVKPKLVVVFADRWVHNGGSAVDCLSAALLCDLEMTTRNGAVLANGEYSTTTVRTINHNQAALTSDSFFINITNNKYMAGVEYHWIALA